MTAEKMNPQIRDQWVTALRSGEYEQGKGKLRQGNQFCCLGVLCELAVIDGIATGVDDGAGYSYSTGSGGDSDDGELPMGVAEWAGLTGDRRTNPEIPGSGGLLLSEFNDDAGYTFTQIADLIEGQL